MLPLTPLSLPPAVLCRDRRPSSRCIPWCLKWDTNGTGHVGLSRD